MIARRFELVIFDCDGVLVDSEPIINRAHAEVLTACGYPITEKVLVERFCGMSDPDMLEIVEREWGRALPASYAERVGLMIEAGFHQPCTDRGSCRSARFADIAHLRRVEQQPGTDPSETGDNRPSGTFWRTPVQRDNGRSRQARSRPVSVRRAAPYDGAGPLSRHRGQPCGYRCRPRRRHDRNRLRRWKPLRARARGSSAKTRSCPGHGSHARTGDRDSETYLKPQRDDIANLLGRSEPIYACVRDRRLERVPETPDPRRRLRRPPPFRVYGWPSSTRSPRNGGRSRR